VIKQIYNTSSSKLPCQQVTTTMHLPTRDDTKSTERDDPHQDALGDTTHEAIPDEGDVALERKLKWKLDLFILPLISIVYFFSAMVSREIW
jgi:hypothetical protein